MLAEQASDLHQVLNKAHEEHLGYVILDGIITSARLLPPTELKDHC